METDLKKLYKEEYPLWAEKNYKLLRIKLWLEDKRKGSEAIQFTFINCLYDETA